MRVGPTQPHRLAGELEGYCPPHHGDIRAAVDVLCERKFGIGAPFHPGIPEPWKDSARIRSAAQPHDDKFHGPGAYLQSHADHLARWHNATA